MITSEEDGVYKSSEIIEKPVAVNEPTLGEVKVAPYSFTIARALETKVQVNLRALEGKRQCFSIFCYVNIRKKSKTESEFSRVSFGEIP